MFKIEINKLYWIDDMPENDHDLCLHGDVSVTIGDESFSYSCTVSATGLFLLRTLTEDHIIGQESQMLPCCGHSIFPNETNDRVIILGCPNGVDWSVLHDDGNIVLITENNHKNVLSLAEYKMIVFDFADRIERFYKQCSLKAFYDDNDKVSYNLFWNEWHNRRNAL